MTLGIILLLAAFILVIVSFARPNWPLLGIALIIVILAIAIGVQPIR